MLKWIIDDPNAIGYFTEQQILELIRRARPLFREEPLLVCIPEGHILVAGDTHGNFQATKKIVARFLAGPGNGRPYDRIVFLGDYVDRGPDQIENINYLLSLKLLLPRRVILLRGNHEDKNVNTRGGLLAKLIGRFGVSSGIHNEYNLLFSFMPLAALTPQGHFMVHGGIPEGLRSLRYIDRLPRTVDTEKKQMLHELLWNDPSEKAVEFGRSPRGKRMKTFGEKVVNDFLGIGFDWDMFERNLIDRRRGPPEQWTNLENARGKGASGGDADGELKMIIRSHEYWSKGYRYFFDGKLLSIFSCPGYLGRESTGTLAAIDPEGNVSVLEI